MVNKNYHAVLGIEPGATEIEIKNAYRRLARKYHPDVSNESGAEEKFKAVAEAYMALTDTQENEIYKTLQRKKKRKPDLRDPEYLFDEIFKRLREGTLDSGFLYEIFEESKREWEEHDRALKRKTASPIDNLRWDHQEAKAALDLCEAMYRGIGRTIKEQGSEYRGLSIAGSIKSLVMNFMEKNHKPVNSQSRMAVISAYYQCIGETLKSAEAQSHKENLAKLDTLQMSYLFGDIKGRAMDDLMNQAIAAMEWYKQRCDDLRCVQRWLKGGEIEIVWTNTTQVIANPQNPRQLINS